MLRTLLNVQIFINYRTHNICINQKHILVIKIFWRSFTFKDLKRTNFCLGWRTCIHYFSHWLHREMFTEPISAVIQDRKKKILAVLKPFYFRGAHISVELMVIGVFVLSNVVACWMWWILFVCFSFLLNHFLMVPL